jgi:2-oxo-4-hydroxy-4-carboxy-5-ureidoimidazoline decarboxylase
MTLALEVLNSASRKTAIAMVTPLVELSEWVAEATVDARPFASDAALAGALVETILKAGTERRVAMFKVHPELAGREALTGSMTVASQSEQGRLGLLNLAADDLARLSRLNAAYRARFGYPFIIALHRIDDLQSLFETFEQRLGATAVEEHITTLAEIASVICARAAKAFGPDAIFPEIPTLSSTEPLE